MNKRFGNTGGGSKLAAMFAPHVLAHFAPRDAPAHWKPAAEEAKEERPALYMPIRDQQRAVAVFSAPPVPVQRSALAAKAGGTAAAHDRKRRARKERALRRLLRRRAEAGRPESGARLGLAGVLAALRSGDIPKEREGAAEVRFRRLPPCFRVSRRTVRRIRRPLAPGVLSAWAPRRGLGDAHPRSMGRIQPAPGVVQA